MFENRRVVILFRAFRLPFVTVSVLPFVAGSLLARGNFKLLRFILGVLTVAATHLAANLINDHADSRTGADWKDKRYFGFFGGSKLIQEGVLTEKFYLKAASVNIIIALFSVILLAFLGLNPAVIGYYLLVVVLAFAYSVSPVRASYKKMGELFVFILFGPVPAMGGYFIQTGIFPAMKSFIVSMPFGLLAALILFANEIPDFAEDVKSSKFNLVGLTGPEAAFVTYGFIALAGFVSVAAGVAAGCFSRLAFFVFLLLPVFFKSCLILKKNYGEKEKLVESSKLTILSHAAISVILIFSLYRL